MGKIKGPKLHSHTVQYGIHQYQKSNDKDKMKAHANLKKEGYSKTFTNASRSKGGKGRKGEKCTYFHKGFHLESACMHKLLACFIGSVCWSLMARKTMMMENRKSISSGGEVNIMQRSNLRRKSTVQKHDQDQYLHRTNQND
jgi:hypothetical protein